MRRRIPADVERVRCMQRAATRAFSVFFSSIHTLDRRMVLHSELIASCIRAVLG